MIREVREETGLEVEPIALRGGEPRCDGDEVLEARFVPPNAFADFPLARWARALLPELVRERSRIHLAPPR